MSYEHPAWQRLALFALVLAFGGCARPPLPPTGDAAAKIEIDLARLDERGLRGPEDGKVAVAYEFTIPDTSETRAQVRAIDPTIEFMPGSRGRIGAAEDDLLCVGSTQQPEFREVLHKLAELPYVERIIQCHFE